MIVVLKAGKLNEAIDILLSLEKQTRAVSSIFICPIAMAYIELELAIDPAAP